VLYAYVDSYHSINSYGVELEHDESDNRYGPVSASAAGSTAKLAQQSWLTRLINALPFALYMKSNLNVPFVGSILIARQ